MADRPMAADQKKARRQKAHLALIDESGLLMAPLVRRTWAPRGQTPRLMHKSRHREKVSVAGALWLTPQRDRLGLFFRTLLNTYFNNTQVAVFLEALLEELAGRIVVVWDGGSMHKGDPIDQLMQRRSDRLSLEPLPPYAPMLMPVEPRWSWLKYGRLCNFAPETAQRLEERIVADLNAIRDDQSMLRNFFHASDLPLPRALLF